MGFQLFTPLFAKVDATTAIFVTDISSRMIAAITPVVTAGLTLSFIAYGILIIRGAVDLPVMEFLGRSIRIGIITGVALAGGLYQSQIAEAIRATPDDLAMALVANPSQGASAASLIDVSAGQGFDRASEAFEKAGFFEANGIVYALFGVIILLATGALVAIGGAFLLLAKIMLALLAGMGPLFIVALLWQPTAQLFDRWSAQVMTYTLMVVFFSAIFGYLLTIFSSYMGDMKFDGTQNLAYGLGGALILSIAMLVVLLKLPEAAAALGGGVGMSFIHELRAIRGGAGAAYKGGKALVNNRATRGAAKATGRAAVAGGKAAYGYFKGSKAT